MPTLRMLTGKQFARLTVVSRAPNNHRPNARWLCHCVCGKETVVYGCDLVSGHTKSCGCLQPERASETARVTSKKHGYFGTKVYGVWSSMITRCENSNCPEYKNYGGRGIKVCKRWRRSFIAFLEDMGEPPSGLTLDRTNNNGNYTPSNCRWATRFQQTHNRRNSKW